MGGLSNLVTAEMRNANLGNLQLSYNAGLLGGANDTQELIVTNNIGGLFTVGDGASQIAETLHITSLGGANKVTIDTFNAHSTINVSGNQHLTLDVGNAATLVTFDASGMTGGGVEIDSVNATGAVSITGSGFADIIAINSGLDAADTVAGGGGTDAIAFANGATLSDADLAGVSSIETLTVGGGNMLAISNLGAEALGAGITTISEFNGGMVNLVIGAAFTGPLTVNLDATDLAHPVAGADSNDTVIGLAMTGKLTVTSLGGNITATDTLTGGTGLTDELILKAGNLAAADLTNVSKFEKITVSAGALSSDGLTVTTADATVLATDTLTVDATALGSTASLTFVGSAESTAHFVVTGGAGADDIIGGAGDDTISGGAGADKITGGLGADTLSGGAGDDSFVFSSAELTPLDIVDGGANTDTILITNAGAVVDLAFTSVTSVEILSSGAGSPLNATLDANAMTAGIRTVTTAAGIFADSINIGAGFTAGIRVSLGGGTDTVKSSSTGALTVAAKAGDITSTDTLTGGSGTGDTLLLTADGPPGAILGSAVTGFENIRIVAAGANSAAITTNDANIGAGKTLTVNALALTDPSAAFSLDGAGELDGNFNVTGGAGVNNLTGGGGNDTLTGGGNADILNGGSGDDTLTGNAGADTLTAGAGADKLYGGLGDDTFVLLGNLSGADTIDGGAGTGDRLEVTVGLLDSNFAGVKNVEILALQTPGTTTVLGTQALNLVGAVQQGIQTVIGTMGADTITVDSGFDKLLTVDISGGGADIISAAGSAATLTVVSNAADLTAGDFLTGGTGGADTLLLTADAGTATLTNVSGFEFITVHTGAPTDGLSISVGSGGVVTNGGTLTVDATALGATAALNFGGSAEITPVGPDTAGKFNVTGGSGDDIITGGDGADTLNGGALGNDTLDGGAGADSLTGGAGNDILLGRAGNDTLLDGGTGDDAINGGAGNDTINAGTGADDIVVLSNGTFGLAAGLAGAINVAAGGLDTINAGADIVQDRLLFDLDVAPNGVSVVNNFHALTNATTEDRIVVETGSTAWASGGEVRDSSPGATSASLVILDNKPDGFSSQADAAAAADALQTGSTVGQSYLFAWTDMTAAHTVHITYATVDAAGDTNLDQFNDLVTLNGVTLAQLNLTDFDFIV